MPDLFFVSQDPIRAHVAPPWMHHWNTIMASFTAVNTMAFHPVHGTFATAGSDGTYNFWDKVDFGGALIN